MSAFDVAVVAISEKLRRSVASFVFHRATHVAVVAISEKLRRSTIDFGYGNNQGSQSSRFQKS